VTDARDYKLDLSPGTGGPQGAPTAQGGTPRRPYLSVHFACCGVYRRIYRDADGRAYRGRCPRCALPVTFAVGEGGTSSRSFIVR
jgi:hypothetical protein